MSNKKSLIFETCKRELIEIYRNAIDSVKPNSIINETIKFENNHLFVKSKNNLNYNIDDTSIHVIGAGKSVLGMALGLAKIVKQSTFINQTFSHGGLSLPLGLKRSFEQNEENQNLLKLIDTNVYYGTENNVPSEESITATSRILQNISDACKIDRAHNRKPLFIVLLSGGGSACLSQPKYIGLEKKLSIIQYLVEKGANIVELNKVRRYFSDVKGGNLARFILKNNPDSQILSLIISDVIGDPIEFIASGPTVLNTSIDYKQEMLDVLEKYSYPEEIKIPHDNDNPLIVSQSNITNCIVGNNLLALRAIEEMAKSKGYTVECLGNKLEGETEKIVAKIIRFGDKRISSGECDKLLVIGGGEATISKMPEDTWGIGGRLQEMCIDYMITKTTNTNHKYLDIFFGGSTDGQDGPTDVSACYASHYEWTKEDVNASDLNILKSYKSSHDSYNFWTNNKPDWLIKTGLTGTNVMDLYMYSIIKCC